MDPTWDELVAARVRPGNELSEIVPNLFLSGHPRKLKVNGALISYPNAYLLNECGIALIVCCCAGNTVSRFLSERIDDCSVIHYETLEEFREALVNRIIPSKNQVAKINIAADDDDDFDLQVFFPLTSHLMDLAHRQLGVGVLVHCQMGVSRSAAVLAAYLLNRFGGTPCSEHSVVDLAEVDAHPDAAAADPPSPPAAS
eukprot:CAMPEP_0113688092 /NCGR_PEP_ID=MMETSP0038_2-20120614/16325_1 /TAXON_ID=2898 /ORGANISM="Cryptomonas paramecium" /LENGTH=198 /DNA_ID=CAMNT_0000608831 /DNA_START=36 /DNA_END=629 /DNA_ORIENTATION=- /assembly_acc=CAM_ASM_000170